MSMFRGIDLALLKFCLQADDGPHNSSTLPPPPRDPKDIAWLREALNATEDAATRLKKCVECLVEAVPAGKVSALEEILFYVEDLDIANGMCHSPNACV
jgi:hypothetical protein